MKLVGTPEYPRQVAPLLGPVPRPRTEPWAQDIADVMAAVKSLARNVAEMQEEIAAMKGKF
jgi:alkylated DNA nucleotide flippase Atl1